MPNDPILTDILEYVGGMVADLADERNFNSEIWESRALGNYLQWFVGGKKEGKEVATKSLETFIEADKVRPCFLACPNSLARLLT
jgi:hypothetical protein